MSRFFRKLLQTKKQKTPFWKFLKHKELTTRIAELTELLEKLHSDKELLIHCMKWNDEEVIPSVKKEISKAEEIFKQMEQQESQYAAELDEMLEQYARLQTQAVKCDPQELNGTRKEIRAANKFETDL